MNDLTNTERHLDRFWSRVDRSGGDGYTSDPLASAQGQCWIYTGALTEAGYGRFKADGEWGAAHRFSYRAAGNPLTSDQTVDHLCRNHACVNPDHLEAVTHAENVARGKRGHVTHCPHGHEYSLDNTTHRTRNGRTVRYCRTCLAESQRATHLRRKAAGKTDRSSK